MIAMLMISEGEKVSDIQNLTSQVQELAQKHGFWNTWSVRLIALTLVATALYFFAQWMANKRGNELNEKQAALIRAKDNELELDLRTKDDQIAATYKEAKRIEAEASEKIAGANKEAKRIETEASRKIADTKVVAANANRRAGEIEKQNLELRSGVAGLEKEAADAKRAYLELQEQLKPRHLTAEKRAHLLSRSNESDGAIEVWCAIGDAEAHDFAVELEQVMGDGAWNTGLNDTMMIVPPPVGLRVVTRTGDNPPNHASDLQRALKEIGFPPLIGTDDSVLSGTVRLIVGRKP